MNDRLYGGEDSVMGWIRCEKCHKVINRQEEPRCHCNNTPQPTPDDALTKVIDYVRERIMLFSDMTVFEFDKIVTAAKRVQELEEQVRALLKEQRRDGSWIDKWGACRVCDGEIPHGHMEECDYYKQEVKVRSLEHQSLVKDKLIGELVKNLYLMVNESVVTPEELTNARLSLSHAAELGFGK